MYACMLDLSKILLPIDFSEQSRIAAQQAGALARHFHSEITLLHVSEFVVLHPLNGPLGFGIASDEVHRAEHLSRCQKLLEGFGETELKDVPVKRLLRCGDPAKTIAEHAASWKPISSSCLLTATESFAGFFLGRLPPKFYMMRTARCGPAPI